MSPSLIVASANTAVKFDFLNVALAPEASAPIPVEPTYFAPATYITLLVAVPISVGKLSPMKCSMPDW